MSFNDLYAPKTAPAAGASTVQPHKAPTNEPAAQPEKAPAGEPAAPKS